MKELDPQRDLSGPELVDLVQALARDESAWRSLVRHDAGERVYEEMLHGPHLSVWLICWMDEQDTGFHDHDLSCGAVAVLAGAVCEQRLVLGGSPAASTFAPGESFHFSASTIHRVHHVGRAPAITLHAYSPPLRRMGSYGVGPRGELVRETVPYTEELRPRKTAGVSSPHVTAVSSAHGTAGVSSPHGAAGVFGPRETAGVAG